MNDNRESRVMTNGWVIQFDHDITSEEARVVQESFMEWRNDPARPLVLGPGAKLIDYSHPPTDFGQQTIGEFDPGWPTALVIFAAFASGIVSFLAGALLL